jgi:hypothetical protein
MPPLRRFLFLILHFPLAHFFFFDSGVKGETATVATTG